MKEIEDALGWITQTDNERLKQGLKLLEDKIIICPQCGVELIQIIKVKDEDVQTKFQAICPDCNETSFVLTVSGKTYISPAQGFALSEVQQIKNIYKIKVQRDG